MKSTSSGTWIFPAEGKAPEIQISLALTVELHAGGGADASIGLPEEAQSQEWYWDDELHDAFYNGVHAGLGDVGLPLPNEGIEILFTTINVTPDLSSWDETEKQQFIPLLIHCTKGLVASSWAGLDALEQV